MASYGEKPETERLKGLTDNKTSGILKEFFGKLVLTDDDDYEESCDFEEV